MNIISIRENPEYKDVAIKYFQKSWKSVLPIIYEDCITHSIEARNSLPQWYLLEKDREIIGCAGLITNDFIFVFKIVIKVFYTLFYKLFL